MKWYEKSWVIVLFIVLFFPVGLFLLWKYGHFKPKTKKIITAVVAVIFVFSLFTPKQDKPQNETPIVAEQDTEQTSIDETKNQDDPKEPDVPEPNTSEMVDYIASKAKNDAQSITQEQTDTAVQFIKDNYPDKYFTDNSTMEKTMYYGCLLEYGHERNSVISNLGMDANQLVKYVYRNAEIVESDSVKSNLEQIKNGLDELFHEETAQQEVPEATETPTVDSQENTEIQSEAEQAHAETEQQPIVEPQAEMVWIPTNGGTKYHNKSSCSNMDNPQQVTKDEAVAMGFTPCKRCY